MNARLETSQTHPVADLFAEHGEFVFRTVRYLGVSPDAIDDALQDVFVTAYRRWESFEGRSSARTWLYGIARRVAYRYRQRDRVRGKRFVLEERDATHQPFERMEAGRSVERMVEALDEAKRAVFILVEVEGLTAAEAAEVLQIPLGTAYSRVRAAWAGLRAEAESERAAMRAELPRASLEPERRRSVQRAIVLACGTKPVVAASAAAGTLGWALLGAGLGAAVLGTVLYTQPFAPSEAEAAPARQADSPLADPAAAASAPKPPPEAAPIAAPTEPKPASVPAPGPAAPAPKRAKPPTPAEPSSLPAEVKLLRAAQLALEAGDTTAARKALDEHARRWPDGVLADEREAARRKLAGGG